MAVNKRTRKNNQKKFKLIAPENLKRMYRENPRFKAYGLDGKNIKVGISEYKGITIGVD